MGNFTPNPKIRHTKIKLTSKGEINVLAMLENDESPVIKNKYKSARIKNNAPNWVQKNIKYAASTHLRVLANLYKIKKEGTKSISYAKKNNIMESVKNKT
jgi:hypothetical protein